MNNYFAELRAKRKELGLCLSCGKHPSPCERCRERNREYMRRKRAGLPLEEKKKLWISKRHYYLMRNFGISEKTYDEMLEKQNYSCAICGSKKSGDTRTSRLSVDHCHEKGHVRGLLCGSCNKGIGLLKDSKEILESAIRYLKKNG